jgi:hypothetical protein
MTDGEYTHEYINFIRAFLINACFMEYSKQIYDHMEENSFSHNLLDSKDDKYVWDMIFNKHHDLFRYYLNLSSNISYQQNQMTTTYQQISFQDFIDERITFQTVGYREYQRFIKSMQDLSFKGKMVEKYRSDVNSRSLKNHIIYVVMLCVAKYMGNSTYFTNEEQQNMDINLNPIAYFDYLSKLETQRVGTCADELEERVIRKIIATF